MADSNYTIEFRADTSKALKKLDRVNKAAKKLVEEMKKLEDIKIGLEVVTIKRQWWQFWK